MSFKTIWTFFSKEIVYEKMKSAKNTYLLLQELYKINLTYVKIYYSRGYIQKIFKLIEMNDGQWHLTPAVSTKLRKRIAVILTWKTTPSHLWYSDASDERRLIESLLSLIFIVLDKIMNKFLWLKIVLIMYINIKGDECKNHVIVNCILPLLTLCQCIFALVWAAFIEKFKKNSKHVCYHSCQVYLSKIKTLQEQRKTIFL